MSKKYSEAGKGGAMSRKEAPPLKEKQAYNSIQKGPGILQEETVNYSYDQILTESNPVENTKIKAPRKSKKGTGIVDSSLFENARQTVDSLATENKKFSHKEEIGEQEEEEGNNVYDKEDEAFGSHTIPPYKKIIKETESPDDDDEERDDMNSTLKIQQSLKVPVVKSKSKGLLEPQVQSKSKMPPPSPSPKPKGDQGNFGLLNEFKQIQTNVPPVSVLFKPDLSKIEIHLLESSDKFTKANQFDFSGLEDATDFTFYMIAESLKKHSNKSIIKYNEIGLRGCKNVSALSLHYLNRAFEKTLFDLKDQSNLIERIAGCDAISNSMLNSLELGNFKSGKDELNLFDSAKVVIINEDDQKPFVIDILTETKTDKKNCFKYAQHKLNEKIFNLFECSESISDVFITERNLVIITFNVNSNSSQEQALVSSVTRRMTKLFTKNVLPVSIALLAFSDIDLNEKMLEKYYNLIIAELKRTQSEIRNLILSYQKDLSKIKLNHEKKLSDWLSLSEQIDLYEKNFQILSINTAKSGDKIQYFSKSKSEIDPELKHSLYSNIMSANLGLDKINKSQISEIRSFKNPPSIVSLVGEAICLYVNMTPSYENFKRLLVNPDFIDKLKEYNFNNISEYTMNKLKKYIDDPRFTLENIKKYSQMSVYLAAWVIAVYHFGLMNNQEENSLPVDNLKDFIVNNVFYGFAWPFHFKDLDLSYFNANTFSEKLKNTVNSIKKLNFAGKVFLTMNEFINVYEDEKGLNEFICDNHWSLPQIAASFNSAKGSYFIKERSSNSNYVITDMTWFSKVIDTLSEGSMKSDECDLKDLFGKSIPIWTKESLVQKLKNLINENKVQSLLDYLQNDLNLIVEYKFPSGNLIIPLFLLNNQLEQIIWSKDWNGFENQMTWKLFSHFPQSAFNELIQLLCDNERHMFTVQIWKNGIVNKDAGCYTMIRLTDSKIKLTVRIVNQKENLGKAFEKDATDYIDFAKFIFMDYYSKLIFVLNKYCVANKENYLSDTDEKSLHPLIENKSISELEISGLDKKYFAKNILESGHKFQGRNWIADDNSVQECIDCKLTFGSFLNEINCLKQLYFYNSARLTFKVNKSGSNNVELVNGFIEYNSVQEVVKQAYLYDEEDKVKKIKSDTVSYKSDLAMTSSFFSVFKVKFIDKNYACCTVKLAIDLISYSASTILIDFSKKTYKVYLKQSSAQFNDLKLKSTKLVELNTPEDKDKVVLQFRQNDVISVRLENLIERTMEMAIYYNLEKLISFSIPNNDGVKIYPELKLDSAQDPRNTENSKVDFIMTGEAIRNASKSEMTNKAQSSSKLSKIAAELAPQLSKIYHKSESESNDLVLNMCSAKKNPRIKMKKILKLFDEKHYELAEIMRTGEGSEVRGICVLSANFEPSKPMPFYSQVSDEISVNMFCLNFEYFERINEKAVYCHMLDMKGVAMLKSKILDKSLLFYSLMSSYYMATCDNTMIVPVYDELFSSYPKLKQTDLDLIMRAFFMQTFQDLCIFFSPDEFLDPIKCKYDLKSINKQLEKADIEKLDRQFGIMCIHCQNMQFSSFSQIELSQKLINKYSKSVLKFGHKNWKSKKNTEFKIDNSFTNNFSDLMYLGVVNTNVVFDTDDTLFANNAKLKTLQLENNQLDTLPKSIFNLKSLKYIEITNNPLRKLINFENFKNLEIIHLENLKISYSEFKNGPQKLPENIKVLVLDKLRLNVMPFEFSSSTSQLKELVFSGIPWISSELSRISRSRSQKNVMFDKETIIEQLNRIFDAQESAKLFSYFDPANSGFLQTKELNKLNAFIFKRLPRLGDNDNFLDFGGITPSIFELTNLTSLNLSYQAIKSIPSQIENLINLEELILSNCIVLETISAKTSSLTKLKELSLVECISLKTPPPEIVKRGFASIISYLSRLLMGVVLCKRTKLMLVGLGEAGKTSLLNALIKRRKSNQRPKITDGIDIKDWIVDLEDKSQLTYSMWDFAGQSVYYNTHQFFLTSRAVYLLVWNVRLGSEYAGLEFWLSSISCHAPGAPIFVVGTHIDEVSKFTLNEEKLKKKFDQIVDFHYVSSITQEGIDALAKSLIDVTLQQKYIGEAIPEVWLSFEKIVKEKSKTLSLIEYEEISKIAYDSGLIDSKEVKEAVSFLNNLGSLQYFENDSLKDKVIINPQWIVDVMACVVSVKNTAIEEGRLYHKDLEKIWKDYDPLLYKWMLNLTEIFDLTFPVSDKKMNIVPCLLPDREPEYDWPDISADKTGQLKEFKVIYNFIYLPAGLFNRIQVRLYQYGDSGVIWKNGSFLHKNNHIAVIYQTEMSSIEIKVQGIKPENIIFIIHEVIETLVNESFNGIRYDYSFPCPDCVERSLEPCLFSSSLLRRAYDLKAPFLQCNKFFHAISINEMLAVMPIEGTSSLDRNLEYSLRGIKQIKNNLKYDMFFWYCAKDLRSETDPNACSPQKIVDLLKKDYKIWSSKSPGEEKIDKLLSKIKESKLILLGISDEFAQDELSIKVFELVKNIVKKSYILIELGENGKHNWLENPMFASICSDYRVIMQNPKRFSHKITELFEVIEKQIKDSKKENKIKEEIDVFISYRWSNSHDAVKKGTIAAENSLGWLDPRTLVDYFKQNKINAWIDISEASTSPGLFGEITKGLNETKMVVACLSNDYVQSQNCKLEFRFAHCSLKKPIVKCIVGLGDEWRNDEISFLAGNYPEVNFQHEDPNAHFKLLEYVKTELKKYNQKNDTKSKEESEARRKEIENKNAAIQELYELTQRKFLKQISNFCDQFPTSKPYPRIFYIDLMDIEPSEAAMRNNITSPTPSASGRDSRSSINRIKSAKTTRSSKSNELKHNVCLKTMCEYEEGWHPTGMAISFDIFESNYFAYLTRIMNILKFGNLSTELKIFLTSQGNNVLNDIDSFLLNNENMSGEKESLNNDQQLTESYISIRSYFISQLESNQSIYVDLQRCELKNGKILWLCQKHIDKCSARILLDSVDVTFNEIINSKATIINELDSIKLDVI